MNTPNKPATNISAATLNASPRTPQRGISSTFSSPGYRPEEDTIIFEVGTRYFRAGLANDSTPRCTLQYGPEQSRRYGDYRQWLPGYEDRRRQAKTIATWSRDFELWQLDSRDFDIGLLEDKIDRAVRTAFSTHLLMDSKGRKVVLVVPALTSHAILSRILTLFFHNLQIATVTLLAPPAMVAVAAGQRTGLVVDIGWHETTITAVHEFREVLVLRSVRAMKTLLMSTAKLFETLLLEDRSVSEEPNVTRLDFLYVEELASQLLSCRSSSSRNSNRGAGANISIQFPPPHSKTIAVPLDAMSQTVEEAFFAGSASPPNQDDQEQTLDKLLYEALTRLDPQVRSICMSRITFTGGGSNIPGLKARMLKDLESAVAARGWSPIWQAAQSIRDTRSQVSTSGPPKLPPDLTAANASQGAAFEPQVHDTYGERLMATLKSSQRQPQAHGSIRAVDSLGSFAGASITTALHIKGLVEIDGSLFLQHGLHGPRRDQDSGTTRSKSLGGPLGRLPTGDNLSWTLGAWA